MNELIAQFRAGDEEAVRAVHRRYGGAVRTIARSMTSEPELIADIVQQTFIKAWRSIGSFDENREFAPWLYTIARNTAIDALRKERRPTKGDHEPEVDVAVTPMSFERTWEILEVRQAIDDLPELERDVVRLSHLVGLTHVQIADKLDVPLGTIKSRSRRASKRLYVALQHLQPPANQTDVSAVQGVDQP